MSSIAPLKTLARSVIDPIVENLWPLDTSEFNIQTMRGWSRATLNSTLAGDPWRDNLVLNKWEFATGATRLESYPWRFSVPFVLCNAQCEFCGAWLATGKPMPIDLFDKIDVVLPYLAQVDMVGWGEPLIHPEFGSILAKLRSRVDRRARIALTTNGVRLHKWLDCLIEANVRDYAISIHAATPETHKDLMGLPDGAFNTVIEGVRALCAHRTSDQTINVSLVFIVMKQNISEIPKFLSLAETLNVSAVFLRTLMPRTVEQRTGGQYGDWQGLDYHRLPPYLHPNFDQLRKRAIEAIARATVRVDATPKTWSTPIYPPEFEEQILRGPTTPREVRRATKSLRQIPRDDDGHLPTGQALSANEELAFRPADGIEGEKLENPYDRTAPLFCPSPYTALYINGFDRKSNPCCYMGQVPGYQKSYFGKTASFDNIWNSPAMVAVRSTLYKGPLMQPCLKCPFYW